MCSRYTANVLAVETRPPYKEKTSDYFRCPPAFAQVTFLLGTRDLPDSSFAGVGSVQCLVTATSAPPPPSPPPPPPSPSVSPSPPPASKPPPSQTTQPTSSVSPQTSTGKRFRQLLDFRSMLRTGFNPASQQDPVSKDDFGRVLLGSSSSGSYSESDLDLVVVSDAGRVLLDSGSGNASVGGAALVLGTWQDTGSLSQVVLSGMSSGYYTLTVSTARWVYSMSCF